MNIFFLSEDPREAATLMIDKHVIKMRAESIQMLAAVHKKNGVNLELQWPPNSVGRPYKGGYQNHPCTVWAGTNSANYLWLYNHLCGLENEYRYRYNNVNSHTTKIIDFLFIVNHDFIKKLPQSDTISDPALAMPVEYVAFNIHDVGPTLTNLKMEINFVKSYRNYYRSAKMLDKNGKNMGKYTKRNPPEWLTHHQ